MLNALITTNDLCASFSHHVFSLQLFIALYCCAYANLCPLNNVMKRNRLISRSVIKRLRQQIISSYWVWTSTRIWFLANILANYAKKASQRVGILARLRNLITTKATELVLYKTAIMRYLTYCHLVWHFCKVSDARKVERIQERALRIVYNSHSETYMNLLDGAKLPSLLNRRLQDIYSYTYVQG